MDRYRTTSNFTGARSFSIGSLRGIQVAFDQLTIHPANTYVHGNSLIEAALKNTT